MSARLQVPERPRILVIVLQRLGDVLLATPLLRTLRQGLPGATVDMLVFAGTEGMLAGNPDVGQVLTISRHPSLGETAAAARRVWRRYDLAISTQGGDRPTLFAWLAAPRRMGFLPADGGGGWWKRAVLHWSAPHHPDAHRVVELLGVSDALGLPPRGEIVCPAAPVASFEPPGGRYAVLHANPMFQFRRWTDAGWKELAAALAQRGLRVVATGGRDAGETVYLDRVWNGTSVTRLDGRLTWPELAALLRGAAVYVGPDTSVTHLAAGAGCPTVALYGPASPHRIGPWPTGGGPVPMWAARGNIQRRGNVWVVQNPLPCLPCEKLGCDGHLASRSQCLDELGVAQVLTAVDQALAEAPALAPAESGAAAQRPV
jgi:heptosyltransferase-3